MIKIVTMLRKLWFNLAYLRRPIWDTGISPQELLDFIASHPPGKALDMGCGTGTNVITLAKHGWQVTGVDFSSLALRMAKRKAKLNHVDVSLHHEDVTRLGSISGPYNLILDIGCYHSLPAAERQGYIINIVRLLADRGTFLLYSFFRESPDGIGPGITEADILSISQNLLIIERKDSTERGLRPSAWFTIEKRIDMQSKNA